MEKVIIENKTAKGILLSDGTRIEAGKLVVSTLNPHQLCFDLIGREYLNQREERRIELLESSFACYMDYLFAMHEAPKYEAASFVDADYSSLSTLSASGGNTDQDTFTQEFRIAGAQAGAAHVREAAWRFCYMRDRLRGDPI